MHFQAGKKQPSATIPNQIHKLGTVAGEYEFII